MASQIESNSDVGVTTLITGIARDAKELFVEQMMLFKVEIKNDLQRALLALIPVVAGAGAMFIGLFLLGIGSAYLLCWLVPEMPLWVGFALAGTAAILIGALLVFWGKSALANVRATPDTALQGLKENFQWKTKT